MIDSSLATRYGPSLTRRSLFAAAGGAAVALPTLISVAAQEATPPADTETAKRRRTPTFADVAYGTDTNPMQLLDIYMPESQGEPVPVVIWIHGGAWLAGNKRNVGVSYLVDEGYAIASINYRLMQEVPPPAQIQDANMAAGFLWDRADDYGFDRSRFVLGGSSAGGRLTALAGLSLNNGVKAFHSPVDLRYAALLDFFGGTGIPREVNQRLRRRRRQNFTLIERRRLANLLDTAQYVDGSDPPILIVHGEQDRRVPVEESINLASVLEEAGVPVQLELFPDRGHGMVNYQDDTVREVVRGFLAAHLA